MACVIRKLIEYHGIGQCNIPSLKSFKQVSRDYIFKKRESNPDIKQIMKVWVDVEIDEQTMVKTPKGESFEGQILTGYKLLVSGKINTKMEYIGCTPHENIHTIYSSIPFSTSVTLKENANPYSFIRVSSCVEDILVEKINNETVYGNITMLIIVDNE